MINNIQSDISFFQSFTDGFQTLFSCVEDIATIKNHEFKLTSVTPSYINFINDIHKSKLQEKEILSNSLAEITSKLETNNENILQDIELEEVEIKSTRKNIRSIQIFNNHPKVYIVFKRPIINPTTNNFIGILTHISTLAMPNILKILLKINRKPTHNLANNNYKHDRLDYKLTEKQHIVLFLYLHRYSAADISSILGLLDYKMSNSRINDHLESLKFIFRVKTKDQLIEKALAMDYNLIIPRALMKEGSYRLDDTVVINN